MILVSCHIHQHLSRVRELLAGARIGGGRRE
jgi:hypothetical protein